MGFFCTIVVNSESRLNWVKRSSSLVECHHHENYLERSFTAAVRTENLVLNWPLVEGTYVLRGPLLEIVMIHIFRPREHGGFNGS